MKTECKRFTMTCLPWSKFRIYGLAAFLAIASLLLVLRFKTIFGQDIILNSIYSVQQMDSLRGALSDDRSFGALKERLSFSSIWHVGSIEEGSGFKHVFYFAGKKRDLARVEGVEVTTVPDGMGRYQVSAIREVFAHQDLGNLPELRDSQGLEILKAALENEGVRSQVLASLSDKNLQFHSIKVETLQPDSRFKLTFSAPLPDQKTFEMNWRCSGKAGIPRTSS
jgi:hypothetical protein